MTDAATIDTLVKWSNANAHLREPGMQEAVARLVERHRIIAPDRMAFAANRAAKRAGLDEIAARVQRDLAAQTAIRGVEEWHARAVKLIREGGVYAQLAEIARASFPAAPTAAALVWDEPEPDAAEIAQATVLGWLLSCPLVTQIALLQPVLAALREFGYFLEDISGEDIPDPVQSGSGVLLALAVILLLFIQERAADSDS